MKNYIGLLEKIDRFAKAVQKHYPNSFACKPRCYECCVEGIHVWRVEYDHIKSFIDKTGLKISGEQIKDRCRFLTKENLCSIYEVRPIVCRVWGLPQINEDKLTCCNKNFHTETKAKDLPKTDILNMDTVLKTLTAINHVYCKKTGVEPAKRYRTQDIEKNIQTNSK